MTVTLRPLTLDECQQVRVWRNAPDVLPMLRTGAKTEAEQSAFFRDVVSSPGLSGHLYYAVERGNEFVGMGGLTYLHRMQGEAEISLILGPHARGCGVGTAAVVALLERAKELSLAVVIGECYTVSPALGFWKTMCARTGAAVTDEGSFRFAWRLS